MTWHNKPSCLINDNHHPLQEFSLKFKSMDHAINKILSQMCSTQLLRLRDSVSHGLGPTTLLLFLFF